MASYWQKALLYLGLVDDDTVEDEENVAGKGGYSGAVDVNVAESPVLGGRSTIPGRRVEPPPNSRWRMGGEDGVEQIGSVRQVAAMDAEAEVIVAYDFSDAQRLADQLRARTCVVLDLRNTTPETVRRLVDFSSGITYALDGSMLKVGQGVILVSPPRVTLSREERRRLAEMGLYELDDVH